jgi:hypothetical protein
MRHVKLRAFLLIREERRDYVVALPGDTLMVDAEEAVRDALGKRLRTRVGFKITGVQLYPHWNQRRDGNGCE